MGYDVNVGGTAGRDDITSNALNIANSAGNDINSILADVTDNVVGNSAGAGSGRAVLDSLGISGNANITQASGAMVIDDLMQKLSTKVQVAAQLLSTANNINKTVSRIMSQG